MSQNERVTANVERGAEPNDAGPNHAGPNDAEGYFEPGEPIADTKAPGGPIELR